MRIQIVARPSNGCDLYRCVLPAIYLQKDVAWSSRNSIEMLWIAQGEQKIDCDILIYNKLIGTSIDRLKYLQKQGMKIIVDIDDMWVLPPGHAHAKDWNGSGNDKLTVEHMKMADLVTCTSMRLQEAIRPYNKNTVVIPNALPFGDGVYQSGIREPHDKLAFIYAGGVSHLPDVELLRGKFQRIGTDKSITDKAEFILAGYEQMSQKVYHTKADYEQLNDNYTIKQIPGPYDQMVGIFKYTNSYKVIPTAHVTQYIKCYDQADVVLAPLVDNSWNGYKSVLKVLESASRNIPIICSNVPPYSDLRPCEGIMFVEKADDWIAYIRKCIKEPNFVQDMGYKLSDWVREDYSLTTWNETRKQLYSSLISK
jgi:glycosyltransferase involved in cell wall biosynthesis